MSAPLGTIAIDPSLDGEAIRIRCLLLATLSSAAVQLAFSADQPREALLDDFRALLRGGFAAQ